MRARTTILLAAAVLVAAGCSDAPTEPTAADALFDAGKSPNKGFSLLAIFDTPESEAFPDYISCANGGQGEAVLIWGYYEFWGREVATPSGNFKQHGELRAQEYVLGLESGDLWMSLGFVNPTIFYNTRHSDGHTFVNEPVWAFYENQRTGEVIRYKAIYKVELDAEGNYLRYDYTANNCMPWKGQIH
jgi:hypothetical protein